MESDKEFEAMIRETHGSLRFHIRSMGVQSAWVDDLAQDTYLLAYKRRRDLDHQSNAIYWLRAIAKNLVMNELAKTSRRRRLLDENLTTLLLAFDDRMPDHTSLDDCRQLHGELHQCLKGLNKRARAIVDARYFQDKNSTEIGKELNVTSASVRKVLFKSRKMLSECLRAQKTSLINQ